MLRESNIIYEWKYVVKYLVLNKKLFLNWLEVICWNKFTPTLAFNSVG